MLIIPAIDIKKGRCVRLIQGDFNREIVYSEDPVKVAREWIKQGAERIHIVDLDGAAEGRPVNKGVIMDIIKVAEGVHIQIGGGIRTTDAVKELLNIGTAQVVIGTRALKSPDWIKDLCAMFPQRISIAIDIKNGNLASDGWKHTEDKPAIQFAKELSIYKLYSIIVTDINKDGMLNGPNFPLIKEVKAETALPVVASGGVSSISDIDELAKLSIHGVIIGKALYDGKINLTEAIQYCKGLKKRGNNF